MNLPAFLIQGLQLGTQELEEMGSKFCLALLILHLKSLPCSKKVMDQAALLLDLDEEITDRAQRSVMKKKGQRVLLWEILHGDNLLQGRRSLRAIGREQILQISNGMWWHDLETVGLILQGFSQIFLFTLYWVLHTFRAQVGDFLMHVMKSVSYWSLRRCFPKLQNSFLSFL